MNVKIKRALVSLSDKSNLEVLAKGLKKFNIEVLSTGGTAKKLQDIGLNVKEVSSYTNFPEIMDGRVKTLHPKIHGALLGVRDNDKHVEAMKENEIEDIDLVIVNLYPFEETVSKPSSFEEIIENIDIGGPSMLRSASKNHKFLTVITSPDDYELLFENMEANQGATSYDFRKKMASKTFRLTASYDAAISNWFALAEGDSFPKKITITASRKQILRYGENSHQEAAFYSTSSQGIGALEQLHGKELSYNNINDIDASLKLLYEFDDPASVIVKHANPCGVALSETIEEAYRLSLASDPVSAFGGICAFNRKITLSLAESLSKMFVEVIIAPDIDEEAFSILSKKKNVRILLNKQNSLITKQDIKTVDGGFLVQSVDSKLITKDMLKIVTKSKPNEEEIKQLIFAFKVCKHVKSNSIILVNNNATIGIGAGQMSRVDAARISIMKASDSKDNAKLIKNSIMASDAFFPFADSIEYAAEAGIKSIIQPGGSVRDNEVIEAADKHNISMVFAGERHFRH